MFRSALNGFFEATKQAIFSTIVLKFPVKIPLPLLRLTNFFPPKFFFFGNWVLALSYRYRKYR